MGPPYDILSVPGAFSDDVIRRRPGVGSGLRVACAPVHSSAHRCTGTSAGLTGTRTGTYLPHCWPLPFRKLCDAAQTLTRAVKKNRNSVSLFGKVASADDKKCPAVQSQGAVMSYGESLPVCLPSHVSLRG